MAVLQATLLENDSAKAKQLTDRWADATKEFISDASQYEVESFLAARQAVLTGPVTATLSVEDFFPSFLETQVYQQSLFGDFRQLNIITFPGKAHATVLLKSWNISDLSYSHLLSCFGCDRIG